MSALDRLLKRRRGVRGDDAGFTLIEMVITVTVVLVLAGAALLAAPGIIAQTRQSACDAAAGSIANAINASYAQWQNYSRTSDALVTDEYLVALPDSAQFTIGTPAETGVSVTFGPECSDDFAPVIWAGQAVNGVYDFGDGSPAALTCAEGGECMIGDIGPGGGTVIYVADAPFASGAGTAKYLEAAPSRLDSSQTWGCNSDLGQGASWHEIGGGKTNTAAILAACGGAVPAANAAAAYSGGGKSDWYLPARKELNQICLWQNNQATGIGTENTTCNDTDKVGPAWSSNQYSATQAVYMTGTGYWSYEAKSNSYYVWPIRAFSPVP